MSQYLIFLSIIPLVCFEMFKLFRCTYRNTICGISIGLVVSPVSFALVKFTYLPLIGKLIGLIGIIVQLAHGWFGYGCLIGLGILQPGAVVSVLHFTVIQTLNGMFFSFIYGVIGYILDKRMRHAIFTREIFPKLTY